ncbi:hypothetical protein EJB05_08722, partial [Eragrostis curvula]
MNTCFATSRLGSSPRDPRWPGNPSSTTHPADDSPFRSVNVWETGLLFPGSKQEQHKEAIDPHQETSRCFTFFFLVASKRSTWKRTAD